MPDQIHSENHLKGRCTVRRARLSLFAFVTTLFFGAAVNAAAQVQTSLWSSTAKPVTVDSGDPNGVELGVKFTSSQAGFIMGIRFYKSSANTGTHIGNLWTTSGAKQASAVFTNESASGWQQVNFSSPVAISANTTYIASYYSPVGHFSDDQGFFTTAGVSNVPLQALANTVSPNGVYAYGAKSAFPTYSARASNYWVDVVYTSTAATAVSLWKSTAKPVTVDSSDPNGVELGVKFTSSQAGSITGIRFYKSSANTGTHIGNLWTTSGAKLASAVFTNESASGWQQVNFSSAVTISANATYIASYYSPVGHFSDDQGFFTTAGVSNVPLQALANTVSPNGVYAYGAKSAFPTYSARASNYWVDVVFTAGSGTGVVAAPVITSATTAGATVGSAFSYQITATNSPGSYGATGLPAGLTINTGTGLISGTPTAAGTSTVTLSATNSGGTGKGTLAVTAASSGSAAASLSATTLNFGNAPVAVSGSSQALTLTNTGSVALSIASIAVSGTNAVDFSQANTCGTSLAAGARCTIAIVFTPAALGTRTGSLTVTDNASGSPQKAALSGVGTHDVILSWNQSAASGITGYYVYRGTTAGGENSTPLNPTPVTGPSYVDRAVTAGTKYYYVVAPLLSTGTQGTKSNEASATVPSP